MELLLKRHFWLINLVGLGLIAWLLAGSVTSFVGMLLTKAGRRDDKAAVSAAAGEAALAQRLRDGRMREESGAIVAGRSIFLTEDPLVEEPPPEEEAPPIEKPEGPIEPTYDPTTLPLKLMGTMVVTPATWSSATIEVERQNQKIVTIGTELLNGQATVYAIRRNYVVLKEGDKLTIAPLYPKDPSTTTASAEPTPMPTPMPTPDRPQRAVVAPAGQESEGVRRVSDSAWQLGRGHINDKLQNVAQLGAEVRVVPNYHNGKYDGVRMIGMKESSLFKSIGFENGDILQAVNGDRIDSPNKALSLYEALKNKSRLTVLIERGGVAKTLRYTIR